MMGEKDLVLRWERFRSCAMMSLGAVLSLSSRALAGARAREEPTQERGTIHLFPRSRVGTREM